MNQADELTELEIARIDITAANIQLAGMRELLLQAKPRCMTTKQVEQMFRETAEVLLAMRNAGGLIVAWLTNQIREDALIAEVNAEVASGLAGSDGGGSCSIVNPDDSGREDRAGTLRAMAGV
jgi:hypothetical protein